MAFFKRNKGNKNNADPRILRVEEKLNKLSKDSNVASLLEYARNVSADVVIGSILFLVLLISYIRVGDPNRKPTLEQIHQLPKEYQIALTDSLNKGVLENYNIKKQFGLILQLEDGFKHLRNEIDSITIETVTIHDIINVKAKIRELQDQIRYIHVANMKPMKAKLDSMWTDWENVRKARMNSN